MKSLLIAIYLGSLFPYCLLGQSKMAAKTYAVVIGIAKYQNPALPALQYSDKDAGLFAAYLQSKAGGSVSKSNIKLLQNDQATIAAVYNALDWLKEKCGKNDVAYLYFSGHGDVETKNVLQKGYLLAWNTPPNNYVNNSISINHLNEAANTLTTKNGAKVILITDACHSGKLAGDFFKGKQLAAQQLRQVLNNQVRLAACKTDQKAAEGPDWGGGRGVFSYYLLSGLSGDADFKKDGSIQLWEISRFLDSALASDKYLLQDKHQQNPVSDGNPDFLLATAVTGEVPGAEPVASSGLSAGLMDFDAVEVQPIDYFFTTAKRIPLEQILDFTTYQELLPDSLPLRILTDCAEDSDRVIRGTSEATWEWDWDWTHWLDTLNILKEQIQKNPLLVASFNEKLVQLVQDKAQEMINAYLTGDMAEMEKRQYYATGNWQYSRFLNMLHTVMPLVPETHYLHRVLETDDYYLSGLIARLQMATSNLTDSLLNQAYFYQEKALRLEPYAAYINNELGNLFLHKNNYDSADARFHLASVLAPAWAIPWANEIRLNLAKNNLPQARAAVRTADSLQQNLYFVMANAGLVMEKDSNWLAAESYYLKAIRLNNVHYLPYERLAGIYLNTGRYNEADSYAFQAKIRKEQYGINDTYFYYGLPQGGHPGLENPEKYMECVPNLTVKNTGLKPYVQLVITLLRMEGNPAYADTAAQALRSILQQVPNMPLAYHYLGKILYQQGKRRQAMAALLQAIALYQPKAALKASLQKKFLSLKADAGCLPETITYCQYEQPEDYYLLADLYEQQKAWSKAIATYTILSRIENINQEKRYRNEGFEKAPNGVANAHFLLNPNERPDEYFVGPVKTGGALKLALLYEKLKDYKKAESTWLAQVAFNRRLGRKPDADGHKADGQADFQQTVPDYWLDVNRDFEAGTYSFYNRMMALFPRDYQWKEAAGLFLYQRLALAFGQVEPEDFYTTRQGILKDVYPFAAAEKRAAPDSSMYLLPGTGERLVIDMPVYDPVEQAYRFLQQSIALSPYVQPRRLVAEATADLAAWYGNATEAVQGYDAILKREPADNPLRLKLFNHLLAQSELTAAYPQLDTLCRKNYLAGEDNMLLAQYHILSGKYDKANTILQSYHPQTGAEAYRRANLFATMYCLQGNPQKAIPYLQNAGWYKRPKPDEDTTGQHRENIFRLYTLARVYAVLQKNDAALITLQQALKAGFTFKYVLDNDAVWQNCRNTEQWKTLADWHNVPDDYSTERHQKDIELAFRTPRK